MKVFFKILLFLAFTIISYWLISMVIGGLASLAVWNTKILMELLIFWTTPSSGIAGIRFFCWFIGAFSSMITVAEENWPLH